MEDDINIIYSESNDENEIIEENKKRPSILRRIFFAIILIIILTLLYARYVGTSRLIIKEYQIINNNLPKSFDGLKIAHFSDYHYGRTTKLETLKNLVNEINLTKPDIIIFTGDFIDKDVNISDKEIEKIKEELIKLEGTYGKYYVTGNHDIKFKKYNEMFDNANFTNIDDKYDIIYNKNNDSILLTGLYYKSSCSYLEELFKENLPMYKINIMHTPDTFNEIEKYNYNLILAGHSHNGQINIPFYGAIVTPNGAKKYYKPYYKINNTDMYISSGIGTSNFNFRLFNRPSFNLYRVKSK